MSGVLQAYVAGQAERRGDRTALVMGTEVLTYGELELASNRLAHLLVEVGCRRGDRVCLLAEKSPTAIVAMLASLKAGCAYVPIDIASPVTRVSRIVRSADPAAMLFGGSAAPLLEALVCAGAVSAGVPAGALDTEAHSGSSLRCAFGLQDMAGQPGAAPSVNSAAADPAHILFTSGSTGEPKGVVITHANVRAFVEWAIPYFGTRPGDRISSHPPLHFDLSTFDVYGTFHAGAELHLVPSNTLLPHQLAKFILDSRLTQWFCVPSTMTYMSKLGAVPETGFPDLKRVLWCGEVLPTRVLIDWMQRVPQARFTNLYGPTEATIASSYFTVPGVPADETAAIAIGGPCAGEELIVVDDQLEHVPDGVVGELCIGGVGLSPGYWRDVDKTSAAFFTRPRADGREQRFYRTGDLARVGDDGELYFLGRRDSQIKSRGYRIELGEIEAAINTLPEIAECAVVGVPTGGFEGNAICCAFAPAPRAVVRLPALRAALAESLPRYMLPTRWESMDFLPKNVNGKIDRRRLREMIATSGEQHGGTE